MTLPTRVPYPGLRAFRRDEVDVFFGRDRCIDTMIDRLASTRFLAVLGSSGSGKSSLVRTGLLDALHLGLHPSGSRWKVVDFRPGVQPMENLAQALNRVGQEVLKIDVEFLCRGPRSAVQWATGGNLPSGWNLLLLVDQFEELFGYESDQQLEEAEAFVAMLLESTSASDAQISVVITMRSEYLGACASIPKLAERISAGLYLTPRMSREECREAIRGPARVMGFEIEAALVNRTLNDIAGFAPWEEGGGVPQLERLSRRADQLPLMQHVLNRLWTLAARASGDSDDAALLTLRDYEVTGGLTGAIEKHGTEILIKLGERSIFVGPIFCALVEGSFGATAVRRRCTIGELAQIAGCTREDVNVIVREFEGPDCNFVRKEHKGRNDEGIDEYDVDLSHESLIRQWPQLREWLNKETHDAKEWRRLADAQERYAQAQRTGGLLSGPDLESLDKWWLEKKPNPAWTKRYGGHFEKARQFLDESRKAATESDEPSAKLWSAEINLSIFRELVDVLLSDSYVCLLGFSKLQSELLERLERYAATIHEKFSGSNPLDRVRIELRLGLAYEEIGAASNALRKYSQAYGDGLAAIDSGAICHQLPLFLKGAIIEAGCLYAWFLLDIGRQDEALTVIDRLTKLSGPYDAASAPTELRVPFARLENLLNRLHFDVGNYDDSHVSLALELLSPVAAEAGVTMDVLSLQAVLYGNLPTPRREETRDSADELVQRMFAKNAADTRAVVAVVGRFRDHASVEKDDGNLDSAEYNLQQASSLLSKVRSLVPDHYRSLFLAAAVEGDLGEIWSARHNVQKSGEHTMLAHRLFIQAFRGKTWFPSRIESVRRLYGLFRAVEVPASERLSYYRDIVESLNPTLAEFPNTKAFAYVAADASVQLSKQLKIYPEREREREDYLSKAIGWFDSCGALDDVFDRGDYADALKERVILFAAMGRTKEMLADVATAMESFKPVLDRNPWDMWVRLALRECEEVAGQALFKLSRYEEALPHLEYGSRWGGQASSKLLAQIYQEGLGTARNKQKARELEAVAGKQTSASLTILKGLEGSRRDFEFHIFEWPSDYPYMGIDDQVEYMKAAGFTVNEEVAAAFRQIHLLARRDNLSFPGFVKSILDQAGPGAISRGAEPGGPLQHVAEIAHAIATLRVHGVASLDSKKASNSSASDASNWGSEVEKAAARGDSWQVRKLVAAGASPPKIWKNPRVSESAGFLSFTELDAAEADRLAPKLSALGAKLIVRSECRRVRRAPLSFFPHYNLLAIEDLEIPGQNEQFAFEGPDGELRLLDWTNEPIYQTAAACQPIFDDANVLLYCRFFFHWVRGQKGRFVITEPLDRIAWTEAATEDDRKKTIDRLRYLKIKDRLDDRVRLRATVIFRNALFETDILVATLETDVLDPDSGMLEHMTIGQTKLMNEDLLLEDQPIELDGPPGVFG